MENRSFEGMISELLKSFGSKPKKQHSRRYNTIRSIIITLLFGIVYFYFALPALNLKNPDFYWFVFLLAAVYCICALSSNREIKNADDIKTILSTLKKVCFIPFGICVSMIVVFLIGGILSSVFLRPRTYSNLISIESGNFANEVEEISYDQIPMLDKFSAQRLGDRKLGELSDMVSQFEVTDDYPQMNYKGVPVRVATLDYGDFFKWLNNRKNGLPAYIVIDMVSQNVEVVRLSDGIKYSKGEYFFRNLDRHLRFSYPTFIFDTPHFEIDEDGNPFWICPRIVKTIGLFGGTDIRGAVIVDAVTGKSEYVEDIPQWVDQVYSASSLKEQYDYHGRYGDGFLNSMFGQKGVTVTTEGYNYIAMNDDVYIYTGITSVGGDESNIGFILVNQRTKDARYYPCAGAEEYSAMASAEGIVQHLNYKATFPLLLNISEQPTYFIALKDNAGLVKMYAMVNVQQYNVVATAASVAECEIEYIKQLNQNGISVLPPTSSAQITGIVENIRTAVIDGNSYYYFKLSNKNSYYSIAAVNCEKAIIISIGDFVSIVANPDDTSSIVQAISIE